MPEEGDLVIGTVTKIFDHGVYVSLDEYENLYAYCHISEVSHTWVRNIRNVMRIGKKVVGRVLRVREGQIDISIKRVSEELKRAKVEEWKRYNTAITLLELVAKEKKVDLDTARAEVEDLCTDYYGTFYQAFEEALFKGEQAFLDAGVSEDWAKILTEIARKNLSIPKVDIKRNVEIVCWEPNGVKLIREALIKALETRKKMDVEDKELSMEIYVKGTPIYTFAISARDYRLAEELLSKAIKTVEDYLKDYNAEVKVISEKESR